MNLKEETLIFSDIPSHFHVTDVYLVETYRNLSTELEHGIEKIVIVTPIIVIIIESSMNKYLNPEFLCNNCVNCRD